MKGITSITLDVNLLQKAKAKGINLSKLFNDFLISHFNVIEDKIDTANLEMELLSAEARYLELKTLKEIEVNRIKEEKAIHDRKVAEGKIIEF